MQSELRLVQHADPRTTKTLLKNTHRVLRIDILGIAGGLYRPPRLFVRDQRCVKHVKNANEPYETRKRRRLPLPTAVRGLGIKIDSSFIALAATGLPLVVVASLVGGCAAAPSVRAGLREEFARAGPLLTRLNANRGTPNHRRSWPEMGRARPRHGARGDPRSLGGIGSG